MKKKIYIGEDNPTLAKIILSVLGKIEQYDVISFSDGLELYKKIQLEPPDLLVTDIYMPSLNGIAVCRFVKFHDHYKHIPVLVMSSITEQDIEHKSLKSGASAFLRKPFKINELKDKILELLQ